MEKKLASIAKMIDHSLLHPTLTDNEIKSGCELAVRYNVATVCVKPYSVSRVKRLLNGTSLGVSCVAGFPHGNSSVNIKVKEAERACLEGAGEIDYVVNIGKVLSRNWNYVSEEIKALNEAVLKNRAILKVIFENDFLPNDEYVIKLCELCKTHKVAFAKTSTGYGFVKRESGMYSYEGATERHLRLMCKNCLPEVQVKAAGGIRTLDDLLLAKEIGVTRVGATAMETILEEAIKKGFI